MLIWASNRWLLWWMCCIEAGEREKGWAAGEGSTSVGRSGPWSIFWSLSPDERGGARGERGEGRGKAEWEGLEGIDLWWGPLPVFSEAPQKLPSCSRTGRFPKCHSEGGVTHPTKNGGRQGSWDSPTAVGEGKQPRQRNPSQTHPMGGSCQRWHTTQQRSIGIILQGAKATKLLPFSWVSTTENGCSPHPEGLRVQKPGAELWEVKKVGNLRSCANQARDWHCRQMVVLMGNLWPPWEEEGGGLARRAGDP